jgi:hypothetical protein
VVQEKVREFQNKKAKRLRHTSLLQIETKEINPFILFMQLLQRSNGLGAKRTTTGASPLHSFKAAQANSATHQQSSSST